MSDKRFAPSKRYHIRLERYLGLAVVNLRVINWCHATGCPHLRLLYRTSLDPHQNSTSDL